MSESDKVKEAILMWIDGLDAINTKLRRDIGANPFKSPPEARKPSPAMPNLQTLNWQTIDAPSNPKGPWEKCVDVQSPEWQKMRDLLRTKNSPMFSDGFIYWLAQNEDFIGRRKKAKT
jgi:hypothetical protein